MISKSDVKYIQSLAHKKFREEEGLFIVEGVKMVEELIHEFPAQVARLYATQHWVDKQVLPASFSKLVTVIEEHQLGRISLLKTPDEVLALVRIPDVHPTLDTTAPLTLVLDKIQDPGNLGTIIRTCDWFGVTQIVCSPDTVDLYNPKTVQSAKGSLLRVQVQYNNLTDYLDNRKGVAVYAAVLDGTSIHSVNYKKPAILIIGNEANGISPAVMHYATDQLTIPRFGKAESLNAAIASAIIIAGIQK